MPMGITRVADQYGHLAEAEAHRAQLAAYDADARALADAHKTFGVTPGMNDPRRMYAAKGDFGGKKAPPFGSKPDDDDDKKDDKPWHEAGYGWDEIDREYARDRVWGPDVTRHYPGDEYSRQSGDEGYDPSGDWQSHRDTPIGPMVVAERMPDDAPEFEHMAPPEAFAPYDGPEPADFGYGDEAYDPLMDPAHVDPVYGGDPHYHDPVR